MQSMCESPRGGVVCRSECFEQKQELIRTSTTPARPRSSLVEPGCENQFLNQHGGHCCEPFGACGSDVAMPHGHKDRRRVGVRDSFDSMLFDRFDTSSEPLRTASQATRGWDVTSGLVEAVDCSDNAGCRTALVAEFGQPQEYGVLNHITEMPCQVGHLFKNLYVWRNLIQRCDDEHSFEKAPIAAKSGGFRRECEKHFSLFFGWRHPEDHSSGFFSPWT